MRLSNVLGERFHGIIGGLPVAATRGFYLISQCFIPRNREDVESFLETIQGKKRDYPIKLVVQHGRHFHVIHSCKWTSRSCDCFGRKLRARKGGRPPRINDLEERDWVNILNYHLAEGRILTYFKSGREEATQEYVQARLLQGLLEGGWNQSERDVEACRHEYDNIYESIRSRINYESGLHSTIGGNEEDQAHEGQRSDSEASSIGVIRRQRGNRAKRGLFTRPRIDQSSIQKFMLQYCKVPLDGIIQSYPWIYGPYNELNTEGVVFKNAMRNVKTILREWDLRDFKHHYLNHVDILWGAFSKEDLPRHYLPLDDSVQLLKLLFVNQYAPNSMDSENNVIDSEWKRLSSSLIGAMANRIVGTFYRLQTPVKHYLRTCYVTTW